MNAARDCHHCGEPVPAGAPQLRIDGVLHAYCCAGCAGAAQFIRDSGLAGYYRLRQAQAPKVEARDGDLAVWDRPELQREYVDAEGEHRSVTLLLDGMRCAACAWLIDRALHAHDGVDEVSANAVTGRVRVRWREGATRLGAIVGDLQRLGYGVGLGADRGRERRRAAEDRRWLLRLGVAALGAVQAMMFAEALYLDSAGEMPLATRDFFRWITLLLSTPVVFFSGWPFLAGMARELTHRRLGMDTLIASAVLLAWGASAVETLRGGPHVWFDAAVMFVLLLLGARFLERAARDRAGAAVARLARAKPAFASRLAPAGGHECVPVSALQEGDTVLVAAGETVPADGRLLDAAAEFDEALLSGESAPVCHHPGETVLAGSTCRTHAARIAVTAVGNATALAALTRLADRAQAQRPRLARLADAVASRFVVAIVLVAAVVFALWLPQGAGRAFEIALAVLIVSCPCALSLAIPSALVVAHGALARRGVLATGLDALAALATADRVVFDKTGTLTAGRPAVVSIEAFDGMTRDRALALAAALERGVKHPLAHAFPSATMDGGGIDAGSLRAVPGAGVEGRIEGARRRIGLASFAAGSADDNAVWLGDGSRALARFVLADALRPEAADTVATLQAMGLQPCVLSGDHADAVAAIAAEAGIAARAARQRPGDKLEHVRALQQAGHRVLMVGDGINDAPVLAGADVSVAMAEGAALAHGAADFVVTGGSLRRLVDAVAIARRTRRIVAENLGWALAYNVVAIPAAAMGWVGPGLAALGMSVSSLVVTLNALRLLRQPPPRRIAERPLSGPPLSPAAKREGGIVPSPARGGRAGEGWEGASP